MPFATVILAALLPLAGCTMASGATTPRSTSPTSTPAPAGTSTAPVRPTAAPPYIARVVWDSDARGRTLRVYPTASGRAAVLTGATTDEAWGEVLGYAADADSAGMRAQFDCHWVYARILAPDKPSWNLEPWRPVVSDAEMVGARCNPGGPDADR